jgi:hypothetical protein
MHGKIYRAIGGIEIDTEVRKGVLLEEIRPRIGSGWSIAEVHLDRF